MTIVFAGSIGRFPVGGHAWVDLQYLLGLIELGHTVYYLEECGQGSWVYNPEVEAIVTDLDYPTEYVRDCFADTPLERRWIYRAGERAVGMPVEELREACERADLMIVRGSSIDLWRPEYDAPKARIFIDADPAFTQIKVANGDPALCATLDRCRHLFTIGQRMGASDCLIPDCGRRWHPTVAPLCLSHWPVSDDHADTFTTVMQWKSYADVTFNGRCYGNKNREFPRFLDLPARTPQRLKLALTGGQLEQFTSQGWEIVDGWRATYRPGEYQFFVQSSRAEFAVAKHGYVMSRGGWFSDRSVCYLASGRPVLVQDTGLADWLPVGEGVVTFDDPAGALAGIDSINGDYAKHSRAARRIAEQVFASDRVLPALLETALG